MALAPGSAPQALGRRGASGTREDGVDNAHSIPRYSALAPDLAVASKAEIALLPDCSSLVIPGSLMARTRNLERLLRP